MWLAIRRVSNPSVLHCYPLDPHTPSNILTSIYRYRTKTTSNKYGWRFRALNNAKCGKCLNFVKEVSTKQLKALKYKTGSNKCEKYLLSAVRPFHEILILLPLSFTTWCFTEMRDQSICRRSSFYLSTSSLKVKNGVSTIYTISCYPMLLYQMPFYQTSHLTQFHFTQCQLTQFALLLKLLKRLFSQLYITKWPVGLDMKLKWDYFVNINILNHPCNSDCLFVIR